MSRNFNDIPEVFRRLFEEEEVGDGGDGPPRRTIRSAGPIQPWWTNRSVWVIGALLILLLSFSWIVTTYTEWLWFVELGYESIWLKQWGIQVGSFVIFFIVAATFLIGNWLFARRRALRSAQPPGRQILLAPGIGLLLTLPALFLGYLFASVGANQWDRFLRFYYRVPFGTADPIFNRDISFYLFELPVYRFLQGWFIPLLFLALLGVVGLYALGSLPDVQQGRWQPQRLPDLRRHLALLLGLFLLVWAAGYWIDIFELNYSPRGVVVGASFTDLRASLFALRAQLILMVLLALAVLYNFFRFDWRPVAAMGGLWLAATLLVGGVYPTVLQQYDVEPNELSRERPYIEHNIAFTRLAFGLDDVDAREFGDVNDLSQADLEGNDAILKNIRLWDYRPLQQTYSQLQELRPYYQFGEVDIDRYVIDGEIRQVMLAGRELDENNLPGNTWVNQKLEFTHGYGVVMNPVNRFTPEGQPEFFIKDLPPQTVVDLDVTRPEIYYGELLEGIVFVGSDLEEFDYPSGNQNVYSSYEGSGGLPLSNVLRRLAIAYRFGEINLLLSEYVSPQTRVMFHRPIAARANHITPFFMLDDDPYLVVHEGRLVWLIDAYTISDAFPYSTWIRFNDRRFNYIRNSVKITVDAYDGDVNYYVADENDPIIRTYAAAFPGVFKPLEAMPAGLQAHIRYPEDLFTIQAEQFLTYHMTEAQVFYNREDLWEIPQEVFDTGQQPIEPYYVTSVLPGEEEIEYLLIQPFTPASKNNMIAWMAARSDPPHYGELVVYELPKQALIFGPIQVEGRVDQDPEISQQLSLWNQRGSRVIRGNLLVIPLNDSFLYVEPLYLQAETSALPELKRVIVASGNRIAMRSTLEDALVALLEGGPALDVVDLGDGLEGDAPAGEGGDAGSAPTVEPLPADATIEELVRSANAHYEAALAAQQRGDWATYGEEIDALQQDLQRLAILTGTSAN